MGRAFVREILAAVFMATGIIKTKPSAGTRQKNSIKRALTIKPV